MLESILAKTEETRKMIIQMMEAMQVMSAKFDKKDIIRVNKEIQMPKLPVSTLDELAQLNARLLDSAFAEQMVKNYTVVLLHT